MAGARQINAADEGILLKELIEEIEKQDLTKVKDLLKTNTYNLNTYPKIKGQSTKVITPLGQAVRLDSAEIIRTLIDNGAKVDHAYSTNFPLGVAVQSNKLESVKILLHHNATIDFHVKGYTSLQSAASYGSLEIAEYLLNKGAKINYDPNSRGTPLYIAIQQKKTDIAKLLLKKGADVNAVDKQKKKIPLVASINNSELAKLLVENGANVNPEVAKGEMSPLRKAINLENDELVQYLLENKANPNIPGQKNPLIEAVERKDKLNYIDLLLKHGADVNKPEEYILKRTPLITATIKNNTTVVEVLLKAGAKVNQCDADGATVLHYGVDRGTNTDLIKKLIKAGADVNMCNNSNESPLSLLTPYKDNYEDIMKILIENGANINSKNKFGSTILLNVLQKTGYRLIRPVTYLVEKGADINMVATKDKITPLHRAIKNDHQEVASYLVARGAKQQPNANGDLPFHYVYHDKELLDLILKQGINMNTKGNNGNTILHYTIQKLKSSATRDSFYIDRQKAFIKHAIEIGCDKNLTNNDNKTPSQLAKDLDLKEAAKIIDDTQVDSGKCKRLTKPEENQPTNKKDGASSSKSDAKKVVGKKNITNNENSAKQEEKQKTNKDSPNSNKTEAKKQVDKKSDIKIQTSNETKKPNSQTKKEDTKKAKTSTTNTTQVQNDTKSASQKVDIKTDKKAEVTKSEKFDKQKASTKSKSSASKDNIRQEVSEDETDEDDESWDVMLSYQWDYQKKVVKIKDELVKAKLKVWMDLECMEGKINRAMAKAIANSRIIVPCLSEKYEVSKNCRKEFIYAEELEQKMMFAKVQSGYNPTRGSDLGFILSDNLWYDLDKQYNENIDRFVKAVVKKVKEIKKDEKHKNK